MDIVLPKVAVLLATYNGEKFLRQQLDSLFAQEKVDMYVFVRDDHSTDATVAIIEEYAQRTAKIFLMSDVPYQLYAAKNFMSLVRDVDLSAMDYTCYCDQDDTWLPQKLNAAIQKIKEENVSCYASNLLMGDADGNLVQHRSVIQRISSYVFNYKKNTKMKYDFYFEAASAGCTLVLNREAALYLQRIITELFDRIPVRASHDWSTYAITRLGGFEWYIDHRSFIIYRQHAENAYGANIGRKAVDKLLELFTSGWYRRHIIMIDELYNRTGSHPPFIDAVKNYNHNSVISRWKMASAIAGHRRKWIHRVMLFMLVMGGYCK